MSQDDRIYQTPEGLHLLDFLGCSGARTYSMFRDGPDFKGYAPQDKAVTYLSNDLAVLWVGGNDVGFVDILDGCVYWFYGWFSISCQQAMKKALGTIMNDQFASNLSQVYLEILDGVSPKADVFTLYVTGYAKFWNSETDDCDQASMTFWPHWVGNNPVLTKDVRRDMNDMLGELNNLIQQVIARVVATLPDNRRIVYVDTNDKFEGHRFCEYGSKEPNPGNANNYFFQLYDLDTLADGTNNDNLPLWPNNTNAGAATLPDVFACEAALESPQLLDWGDIYTCEIALALSRNPNMTLNDSQYPGAAGSDFGSVAYRRIFHPKTIGYAKAKEAVMDKILGASVDAGVGR